MLWWKIRPVLSDSHVQKFDTNQVERMAQMSIGCMGADQFVQ